MRALIIQLARLGDLVQTLPVLLALNRRAPARRLDLLCPASIRPLAEQLPWVSDVLAWDGLSWNRLAEHGSVAEAEAALRALVPQPYDLVWNLNNHPRTILLAHLLGAQVIGPGDQGPLNRRLPAWAAYLRQIAADRGMNRVHLADAWCGLCGVAPPGCVPTVTMPTITMPGDLDRFLRGEGVRLAVVVGAGDADRRVPARVWATLLTAWLNACPAGRAVLVGGSGEREAAWAIQTTLPPLLQGRLWDVVGRTDLKQLAAVLARCTWVVGADTGPLHLGAAVGARALGFYFARARVHETGPYGEGHWVWQADPAPGESHPAVGSPAPQSWPIAESMSLLLGARCQSRAPGWSLHRSRIDALGVYFTGTETPAIPDHSRALVWAGLGQGIAPQVCTPTSVA